MRNPQNFRKKLLSRVTVLLTHSHCNFNSELRNKGSSNWYLMVEILNCVSNSHLKWENKEVQLGKAETGGLSAINKQSSVLKTIMSWTETHIYFSLSLFSSSLLMFCPQNFSKKKGTWAEFHCLTLQPWRSLQAAYRWLQLQSWWLLHGILGEGGML